MGGSVSHWATWFKVRRLFLRQSMFRIRSRRVSQAGSASSLPGSPNVRRARTMRGRLPLGLGTLSYARAAATQ